MEVIDPDKLERMTQSVQYIVIQLSKCKNLRVHQRIDESYYMQKAEELRMLNEQLRDALRGLEAVQARACKHYEDIYCAWRKDVRWLNNYLRKITVL